VEPGEDHEEGPPTKEEDVMKKIGEYTCRGTLESIVAEGVSKRIILFDGQFDTGYRLVEFRVWPQDCSDFNEELTYARVATTDIAIVAATFWNAGDNAQIAWAAGTLDNQPALDNWALVDPDNLIIEDCFVQALSASEENGNYFMRFEKYDISDWQGALAMVRNKSQG